MKAQIIRPFTMGSGNYIEGQTVDFEPWRVARLVGEGLAVAVDEPKETPSEEPKADEKPASLFNHRRKKK